MGVVRDGVTAISGTHTQPKLSWRLLVTYRYGPLTLALMLIIVFVGTGLLLPAVQHLASLMVVVPATTAALAGPRLTAAVAALSCLASFALDTRDNLLNTIDPAVHVVAILLVSGFVIASRSRRERSVAELAEVRAVSEAIQRVLLRPLPSRIGSLRIRSAYHASQPHALIGGDVYAAVRTPDRVRILIGDVKGKGLPAVEDAEALLGAFRGTARKICSLPELVAELENSVRSHFEETALVDHDAMERFITALILEIPDGSDNVRMINCGHPPPYLNRREGTSLVSPARTSPPLGLNSLRAEDYSVDTFPFLFEGTLLLYTDGAIEARNADGQFYDLGAYVASWPGSKPEDLLQHVIDGLAAHVGGRGIDDDIAMVALQYDHACIGTSLSRGHTQTPR